MATQEKGQTTQERMADNTGTVIKQLDGTRIGIDAQGNPYKIRDVIPKATKAQLDKIPPEYSHILS